MNNPSSPAVTPRVSVMTTNAPHPASPPFPTPLAPITTAAMVTSPNTDTSFSLPRGTLIDHRWEILIKIGQGAFGQTYTALDRHLNSTVAIKMESSQSKKQVLKIEVAVLKKCQSSPFVTRFLGCGRQEEFNYLVMELMGKNLAELRRKRLDQKFSWSTTALLGKQMILAMEAIHEQGYLHRDIKPSNFVMGLKKTDPNDALLRGRVRCFVIDFGLARRHLNKTNEPREARSVAGFRGTARYASIHAHHSRELGRRDDCWSLFYILIEFLTGALPWKREKDKDKIGTSKALHHTPQLVAGLPVCMLAMMQHLDGLKYEDCPDYGMMQRWMDALFLASGDVMDVPYDWDREENPAQMKKSPTVDEMVSQTSQPMAVMDTAQAAPYLTLNAPQNMTQMDLSRMLDSSRQAPPSLLNKTRVSERLDRSRPESVHSMEMTRASLVGRATTAGGSVASTLRKSHTLPDREENGGAAAMTVNVLMNPLPDTSNPMNPNGNANNRLLAHSSAAMLTTDAMMNATSVVFNSSAYTLGPGVLVTEQVPPMPIKGRWRTASASGMVNEVPTSPNVNEQGPPLQPARAMTVPNPNPLSNNTHPTNTILTPNAPQTPPKKLTLKQKLTSPVKAMLRLFSPKPPSSDKSTGLFFMNRWRRLKKTENNVDNVDNNNVHDNNTTSNENVVVNRTTVPTTNNNANTRMTGMPSKSNS